MSEHSNLPNVESTAYECNLEETIYHLDLEPEAREILEDLEGTSLEDVCVMCGDQAVWYTSEIQEESGFFSEEGRITRCWCDECIPESFIEVWKEWPWTPDEELTNYTPLTSDSDCVDEGLALQQNTIEFVYHLDLQTSSADVAGILDHYGINRENAVCCACDQRADWYYAEIYDMF